MMGHQTTYTRVCESCKRVMHNVGPTRRFCESCMKKRVAKKQADYRAECADLEALRNGDEIIEIPKKNPKPKPSKDNSIGAVCARAIAAGRTYGQQVEYERRQKELRERGEIN